MKPAISLLQRAKDIVTKLPANNQGVIYLKDAISKNDDNAFLEALKEIASQAFDKLSANQLIKGFGPELPEIAKALNPEVANQAEFNPNLNEDEIEGGKADDLTPKDIAKKFNLPLSHIEKQIKMGIKVELEHTNDRILAKEIATDHLAEMPDYYTRLKKMEDIGMKHWERKEVKEFKIVIKKLLREALK